MCTVEPVQQLSTQRSYSALHKHTEVYAFLEHDYVDV